MMKTWTTCTVQELVARGEAELKTGPFGTQLHASDYTESGTPVINVRNIGFGNIREEKLEYISDDTVRRLSGHLLKENDIVFGRKGAVERHAFIKDKYQNWFQGSDCLRLRLRSDSIIPRYVSYCFLTDEHKQWMINQCSHGSTMSSLNQDIIARIQLKYPSYKAQQRIVAILAAYDDLIENNARRIDILEEMAQTLYREWFVKFRFPGYEKVRMMESELGLIPDGWETRPLREITKFINRGISPKYNDDSDSIVINQKCIRDGRLNLAPSRKHSSKVPEDKLIRFGDVLINSTGTGTLGRVAQVYMKLENCTVDSHVTIVRAIDNIDINYFGCCLLQYQLHFERLGTGSTNQTELSRDSIGSIVVLVPDIEAMNNFGRIVSPIRNQTMNLLNKNINLNHTRDLLLPKLISGRLDVENLDIDIGGDDN